SHEFSKTEKNVQQKSWPQSVFNSQSVCIPIHHKFGSVVAGIAEHQKLEERSTA
ncbi:8811_t:CDS:1, partial [Cetraspora pellucida]